MDDQKPDPIDRMLATFEDRNDVLVTPARVIHTVTAQWTGASETFIVQTFHEKDNGAYLYVQSISAKGGTRHLFPPQVYAAIIGQREYTLTKRREQAAQQAADTRKARGIVPGFMRPKPDDTQLQDMTKEIERAQFAAVAAAITAKTTRKRRKARKRAKR